MNDVVDILAKNDAAKQTTAIIGKSLAECEALFNLLQAKGVQTTLIRTENQRLVPGTLIVPSYLAKGLEFDAVIMWNADQKIIMMKANGDWSTRSVHGRCINWISWH